MRIEYKINVLLVGCITLLLLFAGKYNPDENKSYRRFELCRLDDRYIQQDTLYIKLISHVEHYIKSKAPNSEISGRAIVDNCLKYDMDLSFALAQAQLESNFGTVGIAKKTNSVWNVNSYDNRTAEYINNHNLGYSHPNESIEPYMLLIKNKYLTESKTTNHLLYNFISNTGHRYASNKQYEYHLRSIYNKISNNKIGDLWRSYQRV